MNKQYYVNNNSTYNPGFHHEVHTSEHAAALRIRDKTFLGVFSDEIAAVRAAKLLYSDADGCAVCCPRAHKG